MKNVIILNKKEGQTPLEALEFFRKKHKKYKNSKITYAGRLDPMASGLLILLVDEEIKNKEKYLALDKEYQFEVLLGFSTDTYDILGIPTRQDLVGNNIFPKKGFGEDLEKKIKKNLKFFTGKFIQTYPIYSSKTVNGKQLFTYARSGENVELPKREVAVKSLKLIKMRKISKEKLLINIEKRIGEINGDFRQKEILKIWQKNLLNKKTSSVFHIACFKIHCSSGTYVRSIANNLGEKMGVSSLAFSIKRTKIGQFVL